MAQIDTLTLEVNADISKASQKLETLARRLDFLKESTGKAVGAYKNLAKELAKITVPSKNLNNILKVSNALTSLNSVKGSNIESVANGLNTLSDSISKLSQLKRVSTQLDKIPKIANALNSLNSVKGSNIVNIGKGINALNSSLSLISLNQNSLDKLRRIGTISNYLSRLNEIKGTNIAKSAQGLTNLISSIENVPDSIISKVERLGLALQTIPDNGAIKSLGKFKSSPVIDSSPKESGTTTHKETSGVGDILTDTKNKIAEAKNFSQVIGTLTTSLKALKALPWVGVVTTGLGLLGKAFKKLITPITNTINALKGFIKSLARIAFYRFIRSILKEISQGLKEGIQNLALYSKALEGLDAHNANNVLSRYASSFLYLKNTIATAVIPVLRALAPVIEDIIQKAVNLIDILAQLGSAFFGTQYTKAKYYWVDYADSLDKASGSAKALHHQLAGFDELNNLTAPSSGGRGKNELDPKEMFAEAEISEKIKNAIQNIRNLWSDIKEIMSPVVEKAKELFGTLRLTWEKLYPNLQRIWAVVKKTWTQVVKPLIKGFTEGFMKGLIGDEQKNLPEVVEIISDKIADLAEAFGKLVDKADPDKIEKFGESIGFVLGFVIKIANPLRSLDGYILAFAKSVEQTEKLVNRLKTAFENIHSPLDLFRVITSNVATEAQNLWNKFTNLVDKTLGLNGEFSKLTSPADLVKQAFSNISGTASDLWNKLKDLASKAYDNVTNFDKLKQSIGDTLSKIQDFGNWVAQHHPFKSAIDEATDFKGVLEKIKDLFDTLKKGLKIAVDIAIGASADSSGVLDKIGNIGDTISNAIDNVIPDGLKDNKVINAITGNNKTTKTPTSETKNKTTGTSNIQGNYGGYGSLQEYIQAQKKKATGGYVSRGDLFIANEKMPEFIGSLGSNTAVANNDQITEAIAQATYTAMSKALAENGGSVNIVVEGDGDRMFKVFQKKQREYQRTTGLAY